MMTEPTNPTAYSRFKSILIWFQSAVGQHSHCWGKI
jgi:hypothetical protein